jgi:GNAT superfamily N-acetyltransferase
LRQAQSVRFVGIDPMLPSAAAPPEGDVLTVALPGGDRVAGVLVRTVLEPDTVPTLWSAMEVWELHPLLGQSGASGMEAMLRQWRRVLDRGTPSADSACLVTWPSRDAEVAKPLLDHGFVPRSAIAIRSGPVVERPGRPGAPTIRRAQPRDLDSVVVLELAELEYSARTGAAVRRARAERVKRAAAARHLELGDPIWLAERDGVPVGLAECWLAEAAPGSWTSIRLPAGRWGYVNCLSVLPEARGTGVGQGLMALAHHELYRLGATRTFLYYHPTNPLASVFWARQGYRPLWTGWEVRPAGALR